MSATTPAGAQPYYFVPAPSRHPASAAFGLLLVHFVLYAPDGAYLASDDAAFVTGEVLRGAAREAKARGQLVLRPAAAVLALLSFAIFFVLFRFAGSSKSRGAE